MEESEERDNSDVQSNSASKSHNSLKSILQSKGGELIKGKNGANYQRHGSFCINSLGLPAEDIGVRLKCCLYIRGQPIILFYFSLLEKLSK